MSPNRQQCLSSTVSLNWCCHLASGQETNWLVPIKQSDYKQNLVLDQRIIKLFTGDTPDSHNPTTFLAKPGYVSFSYLDLRSIKGKVVHWTLTLSPDLQVIMSQCTPPTSPFPSALPISFSRPGLLVKSEK